jgi:hypothetical protein
LIPNSLGPEPGTGGRVIRGQVPDVLTDAEAAEFRINPVQTIIFRRSNDRNGARIHNI